MADPADAPDPALAFDDIIDGYFPLRISLLDLMDRRGLCCARLTLSHAPIMDIPGLAWHEPVPLSIRSGRAGLVDWMQLQVQKQGTALLVSGLGRWRWLDGTDPGIVFDPMTRLAEPAYVQGSVGHPDTAQTVIAYTDSAIPTGA